MKSDLYPRPWSSDRPIVAGYEPMIVGRVERINRRKRNSWRSTVLVDECPMAFSHHDTKKSAEANCASMIAAYAEVHYTRV